MKEIFFIFLLAASVAFLSHDLIFRKRAGFVSIIGIEIYLLGVIFSFLTENKFLNDLTSVFSFVLAFVGFSFGAQFNKEVIRKISIIDVVYGFLLSGQFLLLFFILHCFYTASTSALISAVCLTMPPLITGKTKNRKFVIWGEIGTVFILIYYSFIFYGLKSIAFATGAALFGLLFAYFQRIFKEQDILIIFIGLLLLISGGAGIFHFSPIFSLTAFGITSSAFAFDKDFSSKIKSNLDQAIFLILLFFGGFFFRFSVNYFVGVGIALFVKFLFLLPLNKKEENMFLPFGPLGIAISMESANFGIITAVVVFYFLLLFIFDLKRGGAKL